MLHVSLSAEELFNLLSFCFLYFPSLLDRKTVSGAQMFDLLIGQSSISNLRMLVAI